MFNHALFASCSRGASPGRHSRVYNMLRTAVYIDMNGRATIEFVGAPTVDAVLDKTSYFNIWDRRAYRTEAYCEGTVWKPAVDGCRLLILDSLKTHKMASVRDALHNECCTQVKFVPPDVIGICLSMDLYYQYHFDNPFPAINSEKRGLMSQIVAQAWGAIPTSVIVNGFITTELLPIGLRDSCDRFHVADVTANASCTRTC
ncbi:Hypothetical protein PHPALM_3103 [Phytophthora palmivora]|uniref:DDE-1 domain-containing protein n=1 Tax=Phytophthora palmivora TaxID=4796 RepID=A0A2P4YN92_9STRA|nr:Hypothetical protein PHPALM_3103 [Phytophthora palmivora]